MPPPKRRSSLSPATDSGSPTAHSAALAVPGAAGGVAVELILASVSSARVAVLVKAVMQRQTLVRLFDATLIAWLLVAVLAAVISGRWMALIAVPAAALLFMTGRAERLTQTMQLAWPVMLLPGAAFAFIGVMQSLGYGQMDGEPAVSAAAARAVFLPPDCCCIRRVRPAGDRGASRRSPWR